MPGIDSGAGARERRIRFRSDLRPRWRHEDVRGDDCEREERGVASREGRRRIGRTPPGAEGTLIRRHELRRGRPVARSKVVITGGAGFIGSHVADALVGEAEVVAIDHLKSGKRANLAKAIQAGATLVKRDLLKGDLGPIFRRAEVVYHFAANPDVRLDRRGTKPTIDENIVATHRVLEACRAASVPRIVFPSTSTVYGEAKVVPTPADYSPFEPISLYGASKLAGEALLSAYAHSFGVQALVFRLANVVGPRSGHCVVVDLVRKLARTPKRLEILGSDPGTAKSYVHLDDVVAGISTGVRAADQPVSVYNLGSDDTITVRSLADAICDEFDLTDVEYRWTGGAGGGRGWAGDVRVMQLAIDRIKSKGWRPRKTSEAAIRAAAKDAWASVGKSKPRV